MNGIVYTADGAHSIAQAVAVGGGRIVAVGGDDEVRRVCDPSTRLIDLAGRLVLPGFIDSHAHASETVGEVFGAGLKGLGSLQEYVAAVRAFAAGHPELPAIRGWGWSNVVAPGRGPTAAALDAAVADRPVLLVSEDGHSLWANSLAMRLAGVGRDTPDPANGVIERDPRAARRRARSARGPSASLLRQPRPSRATSTLRACVTSSARSPAPWASRPSWTRCSWPASRRSTPSRGCSGTAS